MATVNDIITESLEMTGIKSGTMNLSSQDGAMGLKRINGILDQWNINKLISYATSEVSFSLVNGQSTYTIGSGGDIDTTRPVEIVDCYAQDTGQVNYPMELIQFDQWNNIIQRNVNSDYPSYLWYNPSYPLGEINIYAVPTSNYTVKLTVRTGFPSYTSTSDTVTLPQGFQEFLTFQLAVELCSYYGEEIPAYVNKKFRELESRIKALSSNTWAETMYTQTPVNKRVGIKSGRTFISPGI